MKDKHFQSIKNAIQSAQKSGLLIENEGLTGFSGKTMVGCLQRLAQLVVNEENCYLEIGVFQGMTLLSVASAVKPFNAYGVDNFAFFDKDGKNYGIVKERRDRLEIDNAKVINMDYEDALHSLKGFIGEQKIGLYFVDGPHDYRSQLVCLLFGKKYLSERAIIVVDDCNYRHVRQANADFLQSHPEFKLVFEAYTTAHPQNMTQSQIHEAREGWWNGVNILAKDPDNLLPSMFPPTERNRTLFEKEHHIHSMRFPQSAERGGYLAEAYFQKNWIKVLKQNVGFFKRFGKRTKDTPLFPFSNTYSENLPKNNFNTGL